MRNDRFGPNHGSRSNRLQFVTAAIVISVLAVACGGSKDDPAASGPSGPEVAATDAAAAAPEVPADCAQSTSDLELWGGGSYWTDPKGNMIEPDDFCLSAPAGEELSVTLHSLKLKGAISDPHNFAIYPDAFGLEEPSFRGEYVDPGKDFTYEVPALAAGAYLFRCDAHGRNMMGVLSVH